MKELLLEFQECLDTWRDLPKYCYTEEYKNAFIEFAKPRLEIGRNLKGLAIQTLHHETDNRLPYFEFERQ